MLRKIHDIEITVNGERVDLYSQDELNLRINNVVYDPTQVLSKTGEYSFTFDLPATKRNNNIFANANMLSRPGKFNRLYDCTVNVDGINIFAGTLRLSNTMEDVYKCNLVLTKLNKVEDIFGDMVMSDLTWKVPFKGTDTINQVNNDLTTKYFFPLVCYGAFQKDPYATYGDDYNVYTDLLQLDYWNNWYWESFHPSLNLVETVRRLFAQKGYTLTGDILSDEVLNAVFMSEYIDGSQDPAYNLGDYDIGQLEVAGNFSAAGTGLSDATTTSSWGRTGRTTTGRTGSGTFGTTRSGGQDVDEELHVVATKWIRELTYPKGKMTWSGRIRENNGGEDYWWDHAYVYDIFATPASTGLHDHAEHHMTIPPTNDYLYRRANPNTTSGFITIPADGLYLVEANFYITLPNPLVQNANSVKWLKPVVSYHDAGYWCDYTDVALERNFTDCPVEIQLVRNSDEPELIWGRNWSESAGTRYESYEMYPHESNVAETANTRSTSSGVTSREANTGLRNGSRSSFGASRGSATVNGTLYYVDKGTTMAYDPLANPGFILGCSTEQKAMAFIKNGRSWEAGTSEYNQCHYTQPGYMKATRQNTANRSANVYTTTPTDFRKSTQPGSYTYCATYTSSMTAQGGCIVELKKGDILRLYMITRGINGMWAEQGTSQSGNAVGFRSNGESTGYGTYEPELSYNIKITPWGPDADRYVGRNDLTFYPTTQMREQGWGTQLNLGNFLHSKEKVSDFINNVIKTFNLTYEQNGNTVTMNVHRKDMNRLETAVDIDGRTNTKDATASRIEYPGTMQVSWAVDESEAGAYRSIDTVEHQGAANWKDYIDRGSDKIQMDTTNESKDEKVESKFSYCWYQDFTIVDFDRETGEDNGHTATISIPLIAKDEDFIIQSDDSMSKDGLSLKQRLWFRDQMTQERLRMWNGEEYEVAIPRPDAWTTTLNYKNERGSLLDRYFNIVPATDSNFVTVETYLTPEEYVRLKNGAFCKFDSDLYYVSEIVGYDPSGANATELKLIKR